MTLRKERSLDLTGLLANHKGSLEGKMNSLKKNYVLAVSTFNQHQILPFYLSKTKLKFISVVPYLNF